MAYCTAANVKTYLNITTTTDDTLIGDLILSAQQSIDDYTHRTFEASADSTRYFDDDNVSGAVLELDDDLCAITSVTNGDSVAVSSSEYKTVPRNKTPYNEIVLRSDSGKSWTDTSDIAIVGKWAYSTSAPDSIKQACIRLASFLYRQRDTGADVDRPIITDSGVTILPSALPNDVTQLLMPFMRLV